MILLLELLFPALFFAMVGYFAYRWNKAVKAGIFQKGQFTRHVIKGNNR